MNWREQMEDELELEVWRTAQQAYDMAAFVLLVKRLSVVSREILGSILPCGCTRQGLVLMASGCCVMF